MSDDDETTIEISDRMADALEQLAEITGMETDDIADRLIVAFMDAPDRHQNEKPYSMNRLAEETRRRRFVQRALGFCVNSWKHGRSVRGGRCLHCWERKTSKELARLRRTVGRDERVMRPGFEFNFVNQTAGLMAWSGSAAHGARVTTYRIVEEHDTGDEDERAWFDPGTFDGMACFRSIVHVFETGKRFCACGEFERGRADGAMVRVR